MTHEYTINGVRYVSHDSLTYGDYGGYGSAGLANIRVLLEAHGDSVVTCSFSDLRYAGEGNHYGLADSFLADMAQFDNGGPDLIHALGDYGSEQVWIAADTDSEHGYTERLEQYPILDEEECIRVEMDWEQEAWDSWLKHDLLRTLGDETEYRASLLDDNVLWECYRAACESQNVYPEPELNGVHVPVDRLAKPFAANVERALSCA